VNDSPSTDFPSVSIVVPVRNGGDVIQDCVVSLLGSSYPAQRREVIVVDNGSTDSTARIVRDLPVECLFEPRRGPSSARNRGIEASRGEVIAFVDADCVATAGWLEELARPFVDPNVWAVAGEIVSYPPRTSAQRYMARRKGRWQKPALESRWWPFAVTANVAFRRCTFERVGLFDPALTRAQDKDFGRRYLDAGLRFEYAPRALVLHRHRITAWGFFRQHVGWGYGAALLHAKYGLPWGAWAEIVKYGELAVATRALARSGARRLGAHGDPADLQYHAYEVLRRVAHRVGAAKGLVRTLPVRLGWSYPFAPLTSKDEGKTSG
jgi:glycosyltransferase involved in cell wall biosynthesis